MSSQNIFDRQREFFKEGRTKSFQFRLDMLSQLEDMCIRHEKQIMEALHADLKKPVHESIMGEYAVQIDEIRYAKKHLSSWVKPKKVKTPLGLMPGSSKIFYDPLGVTLIMGPWNYPFQLLLMPLVGSMAAGNCSILKPSELTPNTSKLIHEMISNTFPEKYIAVVEGGIPETTELLQMDFDHIFFTGSPGVGKIVMKAASENLTPVTLELGGKSPVIVCEDADLDLAVRRVCWGKFFNAGQTCVAPDYVYVHETRIGEFVRKVTQVLVKMYGNDFAASPDYARMVNQKNFDRVVGLIDRSKLFFGGSYESKDLFIEPTVLNDVDWDAKVMQEEIFGPILPLLPFQDLDKTIDLINSKPKPLSAYFFSNSAKNQKTFVEKLHFGGGAINDVIIHLGGPYLPFGGVGQSGMGNYHGKKSFLTFSHEKSVMKRSGFLDLDSRYPPYTEKKTNLIRKVFGI